MPQHSPIAVVGLSYRAPGVGGKGLWEYLAEAKCAWSKVPAERFDYDAFHHPDKDKAGCISSSGGHFLPGDIYSFDAPFFNLRADEARAVDPHHRMLLELAFEAAESAGVSLSDLAGSKTGVFSAIGSNDHGQSVVEDAASSSPWTCTAVAPCMFANRLSYYFDLSGPSIALDAACASSTYAVHMGCQSLLAGDCDSAFVSGASLLLAPSQWSFLDTMGALSPEGRSFSYDIKGSGFGRGEGGACLLIKRLDDAIKAGDPIHAIIRNSACNHVGRSEGITMPRRSAQEALLRQVHHVVGLNPGDTFVVEGHGTGTKAGDPIEAGAFSSVLAGHRSYSDPLYIGSLKSNFGHLEGASGVLAIVKAIMMLQRGEILPNAGFEKFNDQIEGKEKLKVATTVLPWPAHAPKRVCVTNFGFGGSNAAILVEEALGSHHNAINGHNGAVLPNGINGINGMNGNHKTHPARSEKRLFVFSARTDSTVTSYIKSFGEYLDTAPKSTEFLKDLSFTLGQRRTQHVQRVGIVSDSAEDLKFQLSTAKPSKIRERNVAWVFTGQGAQYAKMAVGLQYYKVVADVMNQIEIQLQELGATWSLTEELSRPESESRINEPEISQPACTAIQIALVVLLKSWGLSPSFVTGHSSGEIAAAFAAGLISLKSAVAVAYFRGVMAAYVRDDVQGDGQRGAMLALGVGPEEAFKLLEESKHGYAAIAAGNSPSSVTISGDEEAIINIQKSANEKNIFARKLKVNVAYHSRHMEKVSALYFQSIESYCKADWKPEPDSARPVFVSSVTGGALDAVDTSYWVKNLLRPVGFFDAVNALFSLHEHSEGEGHKSPNVIVEIGPHSALKTPIKQTVDFIRQQKQEKRQDSFTYVASLARGTESHEAVLDLAKNLFCLGVPINMAAVNQTDKSNSNVLPDLPAYEWDRSKRYNLSSRLSEARLHPGLPYHPLLGWKSPYTHGDEAVFRQVFTLDEISWIRGHKVGGQVIFPMTGYLALALQAARMLATFHPAALEIREFNAKRSLEIAEEDKIDITTKLRPAVTGTESFSSTVWSFEIVTWSAELGWVTHCHGLVEAQKNDLSLDSLIFKTSLPLLKLSDMEERDGLAQYVTANKDGTEYGPEFKGLRKLWVAPGSSVSEIELREMDLSTPSTYGSPVTVDPPTLDSSMQGIGPFVDSFRDTPALMPNYVKRFRISNNIPAIDKLQMKSVSHLNELDFKAGTMRVSAAVLIEGPDSVTPIAEWDSVTFRVISSGSTGDSGITPPLSWHWDMVPSLDYIPTTEKLQELLNYEPPGDVKFDHFHLMNQVAIYFMEIALQETAEFDASGLPHHFTDFKRWASVCITNEKKSLDGLDPSTIVEKIANSGSQGEMICAVGRNLPQILRGEVQPLEIMLKDDLLSRYYAEDITNAHLSHSLANWVDKLAEVKPKLRVLEVGAGTGSATLPVFEKLSRGGDKMPNGFSYVYTDITSGFFENAREKLSKWSQYITYNKLDIGMDPVEQGFSLESFDLVVASNVLHATPNLATTIDNVRSLLTPNGKLIMLECGRHAPMILPFALLPGWWLAEDEYRNIEQGPLLSPQEWDHLLSSRGFSGTDGVIGGFPAAPDVYSLISATRVGKAETIDTVPITICGLFVDSEEEEFANLVATAITEQLGCQTYIKPFGEVDVDDDPYCLFLDSPRQSLFHDLSPEYFDILKKMLSEATGVLWVIPEMHSPDSNMVLGMLRTVRLEYGSGNLLALENVPFTPDGISPILKLVNRLRDSELASDLDKDFVWNKGLIQLPRLRPLEAARDVFSSEAGVTIKKEQNIWQDGVSFEMTVDTAGSPDSIYFKRNDVFSTPLAENEVLIKVEATGVNFRDVLLVLGSIPWTRPGFEGAGVVAQTGSNVTKLQPGDQVFYGRLDGGGFTTHVRLDASSVLKIPEGFSCADAAGISVSYSTAIMSLIRVGRLAKGESLLIHAASGAVGQACIHLAQHIGAQIFATAGSPAKREFLHTEFNIPTQNIFSSRNADFRDGILAATNGRGVDVVVNSLSGQLLQETWAVIAEFGRFVEIGKRDFLQNSYLPMRQFDRNVSFSGLDLRTLFLNKPSVQEQTNKEMLNLIEQNVVKPIRPMTALPVSQMAIGLRKLQSGQNIGKIVITMDPEERVLAECAPPLPVENGKLLRPDATYVITGGTKGIGLSLASWFVENGARNVLLLGPSGSSRPEVQKVLKQYEKTDVNVRAFACDVGSKESLSNALQSIEDLPPVAGVIHGALFLRDAVWKNVTYEDWQDIMGPRRQGAWNLHELLPEKLDFFVVLSSLISGVGNIGQSIYSGTSSFFDSFVQYRNSLGQPSVAVALPVVLGVGYVADRNLEEKLGDTLGAVLHPPHLRTVIKGAIIGPSSGLNQEGKALTFSFAHDDAGTLPLTWQTFHPRALADYALDVSRGVKTTTSGRNKSIRTTGLQLDSGGDPQEILLEALMEKVSSITMIEREEIEPDAPLMNYSLDSLVSVELRNWIRRETGVDLALPKIANSKNLRALSSHILSQRGSAMG